MSRSHSLLATALTTVVGASLMLWAPAAQADPVSADGSGVDLPSTQEVEAEIDRVVAAATAGSGASARTFATADLEQQVASISECAEFVSAGRYCLGYGWTSSSRDEVHAELVAEARQNLRAVAVEETGDLSLHGMIDRASSMTGTERAASVRRELEDAALGIEKFLELEELRLSGAPVSIDAQTDGAAARVVLGGHSYPESGAILQDRVQEQTTTYWCGPATIQMMAWNYGSHAKVAQSTWATRLGTTTSGTAITDMVRVINSNSQLSKWVTKQDSVYQTLNVGNHTYAQWYKLNVNHYATWGTPVVLHPVLLKQYYPYLDDNGSGHFQLGRGWDFESDKTDSWQIKYYEPWNQQRFNPSEPFIPRIQKRWARNSFLANKAHSQHNIGV